MSFAGIRAVAVLLAALLAACDSMIERQIDRNLTRADESLLSDGKLHVVLCGTAAALADASRAGPCTAVLAGGEFVLVDVGAASWRNVDLANLPVARLSGVLLTHFHSDHIAELGEAVMQSWVAGRKTELPVFGPPGVERVVAGFQEAYALDASYRIAHHGAEHVPPEGARAVARTVTLPSETGAAVVFERGGLRVLAFRVHHEPVDPAYGYRFEYAGRAVVVSGDTRKDENLVRYAKGADILFHEALASHLTERAAGRAKALGLARVAKLASDLPGYHTTPVEAAEAAREAGVGKLVFTHVFPPLPNFVARRMFLAGTKEAFDGEIVLGSDGMRFDLAAAK